MVSGALADPITKASKRQRVEFGDFQTPHALATAVCRLIAREGFRPGTIIEPTCGRGNFLLAALETFPDTSHAIGIEINADHVEAVNTALGNVRPYGHVAVIHDSFFRVDLPALMRDMPEPILAIGNPPWVTNSQLSALGSANLPAKSNCENLDGLAALTGKSNFDISESIIRRVLGAIAGRRSMLAILCKSTVARKVLAFAWKNGIPVERTEIRTIDAAASFGAAVDACLLRCWIGSGQGATACPIYPSLDDHLPASTIGFQGHGLVADVDAYSRWKHLAGESGDYRWRSGIKHDCAKVMELRRVGDALLNGYGERVELEDDYLFPMRKSSELPKPHLRAPRVG